MNAASLEKVTAFILHQEHGETELLLFEHPTAGIQIPAGTVEEGEDPLETWLEILKKYPGGGFR